MRSSYQKTFEKDYAELFEHDANFTKEVTFLRAENRRLLAWQKDAEIEIGQLKATISDFLLQLQKMQNEILRLTTIHNTDGTNSGLPTSQTPLNKDKVIPNSRQKTNKKIGGQKGHPKHHLPFQTIK